MNALPMVCAALSLGLVAAPARAQPAATSQPPMNDFTQAFYRCDGGLSFMMSYDSEKPTTADMATNDDGRRYVLKRTTAASGVQFSGGGARFWTDGKTVVVEGTKASFKNCKVKSG
jgi:membrane-bound inhibitor of C-type lysozyme